MQFVALVLFVFVVLGVCRLADWHADNRRSEHPEPTEDLGDILELLRDRGMQRREALRALGIDDNETD